MHASLHDLLTLALMGVALLLLNLPTAAQAAGPKPYPLKTCLVTGNELGSMGRVITQTHAGQEIRLCCQPCVRKFQASPARYLAKLN